MNYKALLSRSFVLHALVIFHLIWVTMLHVVHNNNNTVSNENPPSDSLEYSDKYAVLLRLTRIITVRNIVTQQLSKYLENSNEQKPTLQLCK